MYKKILTIILLIIILMSIFSVNCYASTDFKFTFKDKGLDLPDINISNLEFEPRYFLLLRNGSTDNLYFHLTEYPFDITQITDKGSYIFSCQQGLFYLLVLNSGSTSWEFKSSGSTPVRFSTEKENALYSNHDIYYNDELIKESDENPETPLFKSVKSVKTLDSVLNETISILPITLTVVVGLVAIRKGISFTTKKIRNA